MTNPSSKTPANFTIIGNNNNVNISNNSSAANSLNNANRNNADTHSVIANTSRPVNYAQSQSPQANKLEDRNVQSKIALLSTSSNRPLIESGKSSSNYDQYSELYREYIGAYKTGYIPAYEKYLNAHKSVSDQASYISPNTNYSYQLPHQYSTPSPHNYLNSSLTNSSQATSYYPQPHSTQRYQHNPANYINANSGYSNSMNYKKKFHGHNQNRFTKPNSQNSIDQIAYHLSSLTNLVNQLRGSNNSEHNLKPRTPFGGNRLDSLLNNRNHFNLSDKRYSNLLSNDSDFASNLLKGNNQPAEYDFRGTKEFNNIERGNSDSLAILDAESSGSFVNLGNGRTKVDYGNSPGTQDTFLFGGEGKADTFAISGITLKDTLAALSKDYIFAKRNNGFSLINRNTGGEVRALGFELLEFKDAILDLTTPEGMQALEDGLSDANVEIIDLSNNSSNNSQWDSNSSYLPPSGLARNFGTGNDYGDNSWNDFSDSTYASDPYSSLTSDYSSGLDPNYSSAFQSNPYSGSKYPPLSIPELSNYGGYSNYSSGEHVGNQEYCNQDNSWNFTNQANPPSSPIAPYYQELYGSNSEYAPPVIVINPANPVDPVNPNPNTDPNTISLSGTGQNNIVTRNNQPGAPLTINTQPNTGAIINNLFAPANATLASGFNGYIGSSQTQIRGSNTSSDPINGIFHSFGTFGDPTNNSAGTAPIDIDLGSRSNGIPHRIIAVAGAGNINMRGGDLALLSSRSGGAGNSGFTIQDARSVRIGGQLIQQTNDVANRQNIYVDERNQVYRINQDAQVLFVSRDRVNFENTNNNVGIGNLGSINNQIDPNNFVNQSGQLPHTTRVITDGQALELAELLPFRPDQAPPVQAQNQLTPRNGEGTATGLNATPVLPAQLQNRSLVLA